MNMSRLGKALFAAIGLASPALAADSALSGLVGNADRKSLSGIKAKLLAMDATLSAQQLDNVIDALLDVEQEPAPVEPAVDPLLSGAGDESPEGKVRSLLAGKVDDSVIAEICGLIAPAAKDEEPPKEEGMKKEEVEAAMDSLRKGLREAAEAAREVRPTVGEVMGMDSASDVYAFALDHLKIDHAGVEGVPALRALYRAATAVKQPARIAQDSAAVADAAKQFPHLGRFGRA
jgi:hypothetical protein